MNHNLYRKENILHRCERNPIITPQNIGLPYPVDAVFNCGQTTYQGRTLLLLPVAPAHGNGKPAMYVATSENGVDFEVEPEPFITSLNGLEPDLKLFDEWPIDPRVTQIGEWYYIIRPIQPRIGTACIMERTRDWKKREYLGCVALPCNRVPCLFPETFNGLYCRIDRPYSSRGGELWIAYSPDLLHWGNYKQLVATPVNNIWAKEKIGPTVPQKTSRGWLEIFHGVNTYAGGSRYCLGALLLDLENPERILGMTDGWILSPDAEYEFMGNCQNTVFATGCIVDEEKDLVRVYYGAADTTIALASGSLTELLDACTLQIDQGSR